jgi:succinate dehydrogenase hydrophobic anchor subunit
MHVRSRLSGIVFVVYIVVGLIVAQQHHYFNNLGTLKRVFSAVLAVVLWWLVLLGIDLHIK